MPGGPLGLTGCPGAAALGLAPGRLAARETPGPPEPGFVGQSSEQTVSGLKEPSSSCCLLSACL